MFVVEGRIGGRWWVWQRFRVRDEAARELAALAAEKRFDGVRLIQTIPGGPGVSTMSRELVVVDERGVHGPGRAEAPPPAEDDANDVISAPPARPPMPARAQGPISRRRQNTAPARPIQSAPQPAPVMPEQTAPHAHVAPMVADDENVADEAPVATSDSDIRIAPVIMEPDPDADEAFARPAAYPPTHEMARRMKRRQIVYTLGAGVASLLLAVVSYEITRTAIGLPDLLYEARQSMGAAAAGPERPIITAARQGNTEEVAKLLRGGFSANTDDAYGVPALLIAARAGKASVVRQLLEAGADPNRPFRRGDTPLLAAAREGLNTSIEQMLAKGGHVNGRGGTDFCDTPLLVAAAGGRMDTVSFLLSKGASFDVLPGCQKGPIDAAAAYPRVREALEQAFQRRLATASRPAQGAPPVIPASASVPTPPAPVSALPAPPTPAPVQAAPVAPAAPVKAPPVQATQTPPKPPAAPVERPAARNLVPAPAPARADAQAKPHPAAAVVPAPAADAQTLEAAYRPIMFGFGWDASLAEVRAKSKACRDVGKRYLACELAVKPWLDDIERVEAWFDRSDGERLVSIEALSATIIDVSAKLDGVSARQRFDKARAAIEKRLPANMRPIVARQAPVGIPFFAGLKPEVNAGDYSVFWSDDGKRRPAAIHLKLTGVDDQSGYLRVVVSNPNRYSQQAQADQLKQ